MNTFTKTLATFTTAALIGVSSQADTLTVNLDTSQAIGGNANGNTFGSWAGNTTDIGGITTTDSTGATNTHPSTVTYTSEVTDAGSSLFGLVFTFDVTLLGYLDDGAGNLTDTNIRVGPGIGVDQPGNVDDRDEIESADHLGGSAFEFLRVTIGNAQIVTPAGGAVSISADGFVGMTIRHENESDPSPESGEIYEAGTTTSISGWGASDFTYRSYLTFSPELSADITPTLGDASLQGFSAQFDVQVPEPGSLALLGLGGVLIAGRRRRS